MADRTFTEGEHYALVDDAVKRETAAATTRVTELEAELTAVKNANDVLVTEKAAETQRADQAAQALVEFQEQIEQEKAREARRTERLAQLAEAAPLLEINDERSDRIVAMSDEVFASYVADLREVAAKAPMKDDSKKDGIAEPDADDEDAKKKKAKGKMPRQSAAFGGSDDTTTTSVGTVKGLIGASRALRSA
jgi:hypothetical protein